MWKNPTEDHYSADYQEYLSLRDDKQLILDGGIGEISELLEKDESVLLDYQRRWNLMSILYNPIAILQEFFPIFCIALLARLAHLGVDLLSLSRSRTSIKNIITCILGYYQLSSFIRRIGDDQSSTLQSFLAAVILVQLTFALMTAHIYKPNDLKTYKFHIVSSMIIYSPILINEYIIHHKTLHHFALLRSMLMTLSMKTTSSIESNEPSRNSLELLAYLLHPASSIFGPWHSVQGFDMQRYSSRLNSLQVISRFSLQLLRSFVQLLKVFGLLVVLEFISQISNDEDLPTRWTDTITKAYLTAQEFRFTHYSTCYLCTSFLTLWSDPKKETPQICHPSQVEWPRSLVQVVVSWNIAMHSWLKEYVFKPLKTRTDSIFITIICTYFISSTLHGFKFNIWSVLLTLGIMSWTEHKLRFKLARKLNACVLARPCSITKGVCSKGHTRSEYNPIVMLINLFFRLMAMYHLAYLGSIFKGNYDRQDYADALSIWSELHFSSHIIAVFAFMMSILAGK